VRYGFTGNYWDVESQYGFFGARSYPKDRTTNGEGLCNASSAGDSRVAIIRWPAPRQGSQDLGSGTVPDIIIQATEVVVLFGTHVGISFCRGGQL